MSLGLKSPATQVFVQQFFRTNNIKETPFVKGIHPSLVESPTPTKGQ